MDLNIAGKVAVVTGASSGIGFATARALASEGAIVVGAARRPPSEVLAGVTHLAIDLSDADAPATLVSHAFDLHGRLDILVNNAASGTIGLDMLEEQDEVWATTMSLNLMAAVRATKAAIPHLLVNGGVIVNVTSVNSRVPSPEGAAYSASKAALLNYGKAVAS